MKMKIKKQVKCLESALEIVQSYSNKIQNLEDEHSKLVRYEEENILLKRELAATQEKIKEYNTQLSMIKKHFNKIGYSLDSLNLEEIKTKRKYKKSPKKKEELIKSKNKKGKIEEILSFLSGKEHIKRSEIIKYMKGKMPDGSLYYYLKDLEKNKFIKKVGWGKYIVLKTTTQSHQST